MRPASIAVTITALTFILAACASPEEAAWTYAPPPTEVAASGAPSGEPSAPPSEAPASASVAPSAPASAPPSVPPSAPASAPASIPASGAPSGETVTVTAANIQWDQADLTVPADTPFTLVLVNQDASVPHNVDILDPAGTSLFTTDTFPGVETRSFQAPALAAGQYQFMCTVHPTMLIDVTAQ
jgi:plastocyanin